MEDVKLTVLDPKGQPTGIFGQWGEPDSHMMVIFDPETQPTMSVISIRSEKMKLYYA
jgi:hypothetical protein